MKKNKLVLLLFGVTLILGIATSSNNSNLDVDNNKREFTTDRKMQETPQDAYKAAVREDAGGMKPPTLSSPGFRGFMITTNEFPLFAGQFLSTFPSVDSFNMDVRGNGDLVLQRGDSPATSGGERPIWAHRATGSIGGRANGGLGCVVQSW